MGLEGFEMMTKFIGVCQTEFIDAIAVQLLNGRFLYLPKHLWPQVSPLQSRYTSKHVCAWISPCCSRYTSQHPCLDEITPDYIEASVAVDEATGRQTL